MKIKHSFMNLNLYSQKINYKILINMKLKLIIIQQNFQLTKNK